MAAATMTEKYGLIVSTTGTLDSDYSELARKWIDKLQTGCMVEGLTYLFEICDNTDPHIVEEKDGAYLIGIRRISDGYLSSEDYTDSVALSLGAIRPVVGVMKFKDIPQTKREGFMVRCLNTGEVLCKLKSNHYLSKKALQRCGKNKAEKMWNNPSRFKIQLDEEFYAVFDKILETFTKEAYLSMQEQERRKWIEEYFENE